MAILVRPADLELDRNALTGALSRYLGPQAAGPRFDWLYKRSPHGVAHAWLAVEAGTGKTIGAAAYFPRKMILDGKRVTACVLGDFCVDAAYRSLGPALQLQRNCLKDRELGTVVLAYDLPSTSMVAVYRRMGIESNEKIVRLAKPLRVGRKVAEKIKFRRIAQGLSRLGDSILAWRDGMRESANYCELSIEEGRCGEEFSILAGQVGSNWGACVERTADFLNWRYKDHPLCRYEILTARRAGSLIGYAIFTVEGEHATIVDLFGCHGADTLRTLVSGVTEIVRACGAQTLSVSILASHASVKSFTGIGFHPRETRPAMLFPPHQAARNQSPGFHWFLMDGDRES